MEDIKAILLEEVKEPCPEVEPKADPNNFVCDLCDQTFKQKFNLNKHIKNIHLFPKRKYIKHIKKDKKYLCTVCGKEYSRSLNLKLHYSKAHTRKELITNRVPLEPIVRYTKKSLSKLADNEMLFKEYDNHRREAFFLLDESTRLIMLELQFQLPIIKMLALEGA